MIDYIPISTLNDFIFCPYSIYLHNVYQSTEKEIYEAAPQVQGTLAHEATDNKTSSTRKEVLLALPVFSEQYNLMGKIDVYRKAEKKLIERKYQLKEIHRGQIYQLWAQYFCLREMGYEVETLAFYDISAHKMLPISLPTEQDERMFASFISSYLRYDPSTPIEVALIKCKHCIYCNLCDHTEDENVYT